MKIEELRMGNLIKMGNRIIPVMSINITPFTCIDGMSVNCKPIEKLKAIPLNKEWLVKFGFKQNPQKRLTHIYRNETGMVLCVFEKGEQWDKFFISLNNYKDNISIPYGKDHIYFVHQLQNLYYAITGCELICGEEKK
jgi:hypothetical protein